MDNKPLMTSPTEVHPLFRPQTAFSILELLVVIAIMAILATMTMAIGPGLLKSSAMSSSLSSVASAVSLARSEAIRSRKQTYFVLAPESPLDERSFAAYAIIRKDDTSFHYITPWKKLPTGVLFNPTANTNESPLTNASLPYPGDTNTLTTLRVISFVSDGSLDEDTHPTKPYLPLQVGTRASATAQPDYQGTYITNEIFVELRSGKVKVQRAGEVPK
jgi:prepilin-type N-terminal cleavage/methylation domain-containing protein